MKSHRFVSVILAAVVSAAVADGPADNLADKVRPVPPPGTRLSSEEREELEAGAGQLGKEIEALRADVKSRPATGRTFA